MLTKFKRLTALFAALVAAVCLAVVFTACGDESDEPEYATTEFTVTVLDENGNPIDGTTFSGKEKDDGSLYPVEIQFCSILDDGSQGSCWLTKPQVGADGKVTVNYGGTGGLKSFMQNANTCPTGVVELHVRNIANKGYVEEYTTHHYEVDKIPTSITVTLVKA